MKFLDVLFVFKQVIGLERDSADAEETEKLLMRTAQKGNTDDVI